MNIHLSRARFRWKHILRNEPACNKVSLENLSKEMQPRSGKLACLRQDRGIKSSWGALGVCCLAAGTRRPDTAGHSLMLPQKVRAIKELGVYF